MNARCGNRGEESNAAAWWNQMGLSSVKHINVWDLFIPQNKWRVM
jgi:hypothetical protein